jgi:hypothetical protein
MVVLWVRLEGSMDEVEVVGVGSTKWPFWLLDQSQAVLATREAGFRFSPYLGQRRNMLGLRVSYQHPQ